MRRPRLLVFASGDSIAGGSGFEKLVDATRSSALHANIVGVVSNHENGGVRSRARRLGIPFIHFPKPFVAETYQLIADQTQADFFSLSGWIKPIYGLDLKTRFNSKTVFNIHPGPLPEFGGKGFYGERVHKAVLDAFHRGEITHTQVCMHFVTEEYDKGPLFFRCSIPIKSDDTVGTLSIRVKVCEHYHQPSITQMVVSGAIAWDGINPDSLRVHA